jgi:hypothetical protein
MQTTEEIWKRVIEKQLIHIWSKQMIFLVIKHGQDRDYIR